MKGENKETINTDQTISNLWSIFDKYDILSLDPYSPLNIVVGAGVCFQASSQYKYQDHGRLYIFCEIFS